MVVVKTTISISLVVECDKQFGIINIVHTLSGHYVCGIAEKYHT